MKAKFTTNLTNGIPFPRSPHDALVLEFAMGPEVDEQAESISGCFEVVVDLGPMFVGKCGDGFDLDKDLAGAIQVGLIGLLERPTLVAQLEC
jgi:hypothetical protein